MMAYKKKFVVSKVTREEEVTLQNKTQDEQPRVSEEENVNEKPPKRSNKSSKLLKKKKHAKG
jgi:hypothetical protein